MKKLVLPLLIILSLSSLCACANRSSSGNTLVRGLNQGSSSQETGAPATVIRVNPGVVAIYDGKAEPLNAGMSVPSYAILRSNEKGSAQLSFPNGATLKISPNSEVALADVAPASSANSSRSSGFAKKLSGILGESENRSPSETYIGVRGLR